jgi:hypothetical protein
MSLYKIQSELKAPKGQYNSFGQYKYRSCEDIVEAVKPLLAKYKAHLLISDDIVLVGDRYYIKATATLKFEDGDSYSVSAFAREPLSKKGMDESQITGASSSYARKYALNGLFAIDDTKDADAMNNTEQQAIIMVGKKYLNEIKTLIEQTNTDEKILLKFYKVNNLEDVPYEKVKAQLNKKLQKKAS